MAKHGLVSFRNCGLVPSSSSFCYAYLADQGDRDEAIASMLMVGESTVHPTRQRYVEEGVELALSERPRKGREKKLAPQAEAFLIATACSTPPSGRES